MKKILNKYIKYILILVIVILIIIIGFLYSNDTTIKYEEKEIEIVKSEEKIEEKIVNKFKVDIKGSVKNPGVYELEENKRVIDVIKASGGLLKNAETSNINLSKKIKDEMVIIIYSKEEIEKLKKDNTKIITKYEIIEKECICPNSTNDACIKDNKEITEDNKIEKEEIKIDNNEEKEGTKLVNINTASKEELLSLNGIGEAKADQIIEYRNTNSFKEIEDIKNIKGIGDSVFEKIKDYITT